MYPEKKIKGGRGERERNKEDRRYPKNVTAKEMKVM